MNAKAYQFQEAILAPTTEDRNALLQTFINQHNYKISPTEIIEIAQIVCAVAEVVCPYIEVM